MSILSRLFGRHPAASAPAQTRAPAPVDSENDFDFDAFGDRFVQIRSIDFFGQYSRSPDGAYLLAWRDGNDAGTHGGHRSVGPGRFYLFRGQTLVAKGRAERPNDGKVANDGSFILNDWKFGDGLKGTFFAYRADGSLILKRDFAANLYNNGIATDGRMAACQTCNAPAPDGSVLATFDLRSGTEIAAWVPDSGWASDYSFPAGDATIRLHYRDDEAFDFSLDGHFIERQRWISTQSRSGNIYVLHNLLREQDGAIAPELAATILDGVQSALASPKFDEAQRPLALKVRGLCQESRGELDEALASYEAAIGLDPKIGLKRKAANLRRMLS